MYPNSLRTVWLVAISLFIIGCGGSDKKDVLKVEYIAHAAFRFNLNDHSILIDPFADTIWIGYKFPRNITADAVLITHPHYDHDGGRFRGISPYWENQMRIIEDAGNYQSGPFKLTGLVGKHCDPYGKEFDQKNVIWMIEAAGLKMIHLGDNGPLTEDHYRVIGKPDILFAPIDGQYHILKADEIGEIINKLSPQVIVPMHYRLPDLEEEGSPRTLGNIDPYLLGRDNVETLQSHIKEFGVTSLPDKQTIMVFRHSPDVKN